MHQLFFQETNEPLLIFPYEHSMMNNASRSLPTIWVLVCMVINTGFIQPDEIFSGNIAVFHLPSSSFLSIVAFDTFLCVMARWQNST